MLKQAGYATALVGKLHVKPEAALAYDAWLEPERPLVRDVAAMGHAAGKWLREQAPAAVLSHRRLQRSAPRGRRVEFRQYAPTGPK